MAFADLLGPRLADLADFDRDTALHAGVAPSRVRQWSRVHDVYFGKTKFTRKQAQARKAAGSMPLDQLGLIERKLSVVSDPAERWRLRLELVGFSGRYDALSRLADSLIQVEKPAPKKACRFTKTRGGMRTVALTYNQRDIADLEFVLRSMINPELPAAEQMADALVRLLRGDGDGLARAVPRPVVMVPFPEWTRIQSGAGDEVTLTLTDGTTMTGAEFLAYEFGEALEVAAFHPAEGAVNLYRTARFANDKQRTLASMMTRRVRCRDAGMGLIRARCIISTRGGSVGRPTLRIWCRCAGSITVGMMTTQRCEDTGASTSETAPQFGYRPGAHR